MWIVCGEFVFLICKLIYGMESRIWLNLSFVRNIFGNIEKCKK